MRTKFTLSLLTFVTAILLSSYLYLSACAGRALKGPEFARFSITILKSFAHSHEGGASRAFSLSQEALSAIPSNGTIDLDGHSYTFPLPKYGIRSEKSVGRLHFLAFVSPDEMQEYFDSRFASRWLDKCGSNGSRPFPAKPECSYDRDSAILFNVRYQRV
jgi:hypothetical protein